MEESTAAAESAGSSEDEAMKTQQMAELRAASVAISHPTEGEVDADHEVRFFQIFFKKSRLDFDRKSINHMRRGRRRRRG